MPIARMGTALLLAASLAAAASGDASAASAADGSIASGTQTTAVRDQLPSARGVQVAQANPASRPPSGAARDPNCPGSDNRALMCRLVNEYRAKNGLKPVQLDAAVSRESQYWSDHLDKWHACWFLHHDSNYHARMKARFPGRKFRENAACSGMEEGGAQYILQRWINSSGHRQNMLTPEWKTIGVGVTDNIWVINFVN